MNAKGPEKRAFFLRCEPAKQGLPLYFWGRGEALAVLLRCLLSDVESPFRAGRMGHREHPLIDTVILCLARKTA
jgi:hypothetical protein